MALDARPARPLRGLVLVSMAVGADLARALPLAGVRRRNLLVAALALGRDDVRSCVRAMAALALALVVHDDRRHVAVSACVTSQAVPRTRALCRCGLGRKNVALRAVRRCVGAELASHLVQGVRDRALFLVALHTHRRRWADHLCAREIVAFGARDLVDRHMNAMVSAT